MLTKLLDFYPIFATPIVGSNAFDTSCQATLPVCLGIIEKANSFEEAIRYAVAVGGDSDTIACIVGAIAEALWGVPQKIMEEAVNFLSRDILKIIANFTITTCLNKLKMKNS